jgi:3-oxoacyl-[acyl-carrier protein] reductase
VPYPISIQGKIAVVIGGAGGIGAATAQMLAEAGAQVAITHRPGPDKARDAADIVARLSGTGHTALPADVADTATLLSLRDAVAERFGRLDILVNTAGFTKPIAHGDLEALDDELIDRMFQVNWRGQFAAIRTFAPMLKATGDGLIVSISSLSALNGNGSSVAYCATKAGIDVMTKSLARALAPEIRVMAVSPSVVDTTFVAGRGPEFNAKAGAATPLRRVATAEDVAAAVVACATHLGYSTGSTIVVDGGRAL